MSLPIEILDHILDFLQSDTATLKVCLQTHSILSSLTERHLYTNVTIDDCLPADQNDFCEALRDRPHIVNHVRTLEIRCSRIRRANILTGIIPFWPKLVMLEAIRVVHTGPISVGPLLLPEEFRNPFLGCLRLPSLKQIYIENICLSLSAFTHCKHISKLSLRWWSHDGGSLDTSALPTIDSLVLHALNMDSVVPLANWLQSRNLSSLEFSDRLCLTGLSQILNSCSHSLTSLDVCTIKDYQTCYDFQVLFTHDDPIPIPIPIPLSQLNLEQLTIHAKLNYSRLGRRFYSPIPAITKLVETASPLRVKRLTLDFSFDLKSYEDDQQRIADALCGPLRSLLVSADAIDAIYLQVSSDLNIPRHVILSLFAGHSDLVQFVENGRVK